MRTDEYPDYVYDDGDAGGDDGFCCYDDLLRALSVASFTTVKLLLDGSRYLQLLQFKWTLRKM